MAVHMGLAEELVAVFPSLEEVQWPIEVVNEDITGGEETIENLVGGFKYFLFSPLPGE